MSIPVTINHEIQKMLKDKNLYTGVIDGIIGEQSMTGIENLFFMMLINYAGWKIDRKLIAAEELLYKSQNIDVGTIDGLNDHYLQHARELYNANHINTWRDKLEDILKDNKPTVKLEDILKDNKTSIDSEWSQKYKLTQNALEITSNQYDVYRYEVGYIESRNNPNMGAGGANNHYWGMYQFGSAATESTSKFLNEYTNKVQFKSNQDLAEKHFDALSYLNHKYLMNVDKYVKLTSEQKLAVLGYAHNQGAGGARQWLLTGIEGRDAFGTSGKKYYNAIINSLKVKSDQQITSNKFIYIGDSVAVGLFYANMPDGSALDPLYASSGISPKNILKNIQNISSNVLSDKIVVLSAGLLNNVTDKTNVELCIRTLKSANAEVRLVGGPIPNQAKKDVVSVNNDLQNIAAQENIVFLGSYESADGVHPKIYKSYNIHVSDNFSAKWPKSLLPPESTSEYEAKKSIKEEIEAAKISSIKTSSLNNININQLKFIRGIGETESGYSKKEAYSEYYNKASNNRNVREYGQKGADYGYYQCNEFDVDHAIKLGVPKDIACHLNGGGQNGKSNVEQQTIAIHEYISRHYKDVYESLKSGSKKSFHDAINSMNGKWFGLKDRPEEAEKIWNKSCTIETLFPECIIVSNTSNQIVISEVFKTPNIIVQPNKIFNWPKQNDCLSFYGEVGANQVKCQVPFPMVLAWDKGTKLTSYSCHKLVKDPMERIWNRVYEHYGYNKIVELRLNLFGGCLNVRKMRGGSSWSMHAWGIAVDIDPEHNDLNMNKNEASLSKPIYDKFWEFVYDEGAISLGRERDFDWMHFQWSRL